MQSAESMTSAQKMCFFPLSHLRKSTLVLLLKIICWVHKGRRERNGITKKLNAVPTDFPKHMGKRQGETLRAVLVTKVKNK